MNRLPVPHARAVTRLAEILQETVDLLDGADLLEGDDGALVVPESSLIQQCIELASDVMSGEDEPIRTLHHFACTGGTLISQVVAAMPNVQLLSELDPLSPLEATKPGAFVPTNMQALLQHGTRPVRQDQLLDLFSAQLEVAYRQARSHGHYLVIRDHTHSHFCTGDRIPDRPSVRELLGRVAPVVSLVSVRDPLDSFVALQLHKWVHFEPRTFDEYCIRYLAFLDRYHDQPVMRYEDFVRNPQDEMARACEHLRLPYFDGFESLYSVFTLSGASGRKFARIVEPPSRPERQQLLGTARASPHYRELAERLGYPIEPA